MSYEPENPTSDIGDDAQRWLFAEFERISEEIILLRQENAAGAGGAGGLIQRVTVAMPDITTGTWETVPFDTGQVPVPVNVTQDPANNRFSIDAVGTWFFSIYGVMSFSKETTDRILNWRFYDEIAGGPISPDPFPIPAENQKNFAQWAASALYPVDDAIKGHWLHLELGGSTSSDPFINVTLEKAGVAAIKVLGI
jgi:hypothetical protein